MSQSLAKDYPARPLAAEAARTAFADKVARRRAMADAVAAQDARTRALATRVPARAAAMPESYPDLSLREREVIALVCEGLTNGEIAARMLVTEETVKSHVKKSLAKTTTRNRAHLVAVLLTDPSIGYCDDEAVDVMSISQQKAPTAEGAEAALSERSSQTLTIVPEEGFPRSGGGDHA
jgi:DNA-binding CsgD family transcriptional regulator